jgi:hypothetical protein
MAASTGYMPLLVAFGSHQRLHNESGLFKSTILIDPIPVVLVVGYILVMHEKVRTCSGIV